ncbi:hypothetical protein LCGC14_1657800 [marine sediment metagenome]|uniref:Uncharacterized protein n=1 Tax=marine sediment metagenome TaxID=412755 RepID=A0A0F9HUZ4_9ZZZZ
MTEWLLVMFLVSWQPDHEVITERFPSYQECQRVGLQIKNALPERWTFRNSGEFMCVEVKTN